MTTTAQQQPAQDEMIDFGKLSQAIKRQWKLGLACTAGGLVVAGVLTARSPRIWQAEFQIVVSEEQSGSGLANLLSGSGLAGLLGGGGSISTVGSNLDTEKTILTSPSVLLPVYAFVRKRDPFAAQATFSAWAGAVSVKEEKKTSVLKVSYQGTDPHLVLAASQKLSETYQRYAGRKRLRSLQAMVSYLKEQINLFEPRALASRKAAEAFANRYTLTKADSVPTSGGSGTLSFKNDLGSLLGGAINTIATGSSAGSLKDQETHLNKQILELRYQLARVRRAGNREPIHYSTNQGGALASLLGAQPNTGSLQEFDRLIAERRSRLNDNDPSITLLLNQRQVIVASMNRQLTKELESAIQLSEVQLASMQRPAGVIERFQELSRQANREESTLTVLENKLAEQELELARDTQPWELISTPTLLPKPVKPLPQRNLALGLVAGVVLGGGAALWRDRRSGLVHHLDELLELLPYPLLGQLNSAHSERWQGVLELLAHGPLAGAPQVAVVAAGELGERAQHFAAELQRTLQTADPAAQVLLTADLMVAGRAQAQLLVAGLGIATSDALKELHDDLTLQGRPVAGLVLLSDPAAGDDA
ncbi:MAG: hypothetical protein FJ060_02635 [Cyanobacteria bacterium K_Offshore_0m_m2_072]|nr:hypothetical protein [Cyanobacteria bacterium K_Offshore_0m_m2_072]